eukprot:2825148-Amphidinium_carterae.2
MVSKGSLSLPKWLLGSSRQQVKRWKLPHPFPLVKSKCFGRCCKPGHSCLRRRNGESCLAPMLPGLLAGDYSTGFERACSLLRCFLRNLLGCRGSGAAGSGFGRLVW